jgi:hypothetical protein
VVVKIFGIAVIAMLLSSLGCRGRDPGSCERVPTTADGCRELCHDRGVEMSFFRYAPEAYRCDATCVCGEERLR